jgi:DNA-binding SARP family transcriptional activator
MDFRILGPVEVRGEDGPVPLGGAKQRALLGLLIVHANEVVPTDRLVDELWGERPPRTASAMVQVYVSRLRKTLEPGRAPGTTGRLLVTQPPGYVLRVGPGQLDRDRFEQLMHEAREARVHGGHGEAKTKLLEALALWRGPALADLAFAPFAQAEIARLEELRLAAIEDRIDSDLALGLDAEVVGELEGLTGQHPLRERLRALLMLALYRSGRQAEALDVYQSTRRDLLDELGIEPSRELQDLERRVLNQDAALDAPVVAVPHEVDERVAEGESDVRTGGPFLGRDRELAELLAGLEDAIGGRGRLFLVAGEPGIGKSRLAEELTVRARARGAHVLVGRAWEAGGAPAFWPWVQALRSYVRETSPDALHAQLGSGAADVAQILPELRELFPDLPALPPLDADSARFRLFDSTASFLTNAARERPLVIALDDLHAADTPSLLLLRFVADGLAGARVLLVATYRDVDPLVGEQLADVLAGLARAGSTRRLELAGLAEPDVVRFLELATEEGQQTRLAAAIHHETDGNPFFVGEIVQLLRSEGRLADRRADAVPLGIPATVRQVIGRRLGHTSPECRRILTLASVLGRELDFDVLARLSDQTADELVETLDEAMTNRLVAEVPGSPGRLRFAHVLVRDTIYDELTGVRRARLHRAAGDAIEELHRTSLEPRLAELAHHFSSAMPGGDPAKAVEYARTAGERASALLAYEEAARLFTIALTSLEAMPGADARARCELLLDLGDAQARAGEMDDARRTFFEAAESSRAAELPEHLARAALGYGGRFVWARATNDPRVVTLLEAARSALGEEDSALRARVLARLAGARRSERDCGPRDRLSREAVEVARRAGDPSALAYALDGRCAVLLLPDNPAERVEAAAELLRAAEHANEKEAAFQAHVYRALALVQIGDMDAARVALDEAAPIADDLRQPAQRWVVAGTQAAFDLFAGRLTVVEESMSLYRELGVIAHERDALATELELMYVLQRELGCLAELEPAISEAVGLYPDYPFGCMLAHLHSELGREAEARVAFDHQAADDFARLNRDNEWLLGMSFLPEVAAFLGDTARAGTIYTLLRPFAEHNVFSHVSPILGSMHRYLGLCAGTAMLLDDAEHHFERAIDLNAAMGSRPWVAWTQHDYARMLLGRGRKADREHAAALLASARHTADELGLVALAGRIERLATA